MKTLNAFLFFVLVSTLVGCSTAGSAMSTLAVSGGKSIMADQDCDFDLKESTTSLNDYREVGMINECDGQRTLESFKAKIKPQVCKLQRDLVIARPIDLGTYCQARVYRLLKR